MAGTLEDEHARRSVPAVKSALVAAPLDVASVAWGAGKGGRRRPNPTASRGTWVMPTTQATPTLSRAGRCPGEGISSAVISSNAITAVQTRSPFRLRCAVSARIQAPPETVWELLTRADSMERWNSTLTSIDGEIQLGGTVKMRIPEAPGRTFTIKVVRFVPNKEMEWRQGTPAIFLGVRTYEVTPTPEGIATGFQMTETFAGILLPVLARRLPDFGPIFERYAADLKAIAEQ